MDFENHTPFSALVYDIVDPHGEELHVIAARGTYELRGAPAVVTGDTAEGEGGQATHAAALAEEQQELSFTDEYHGELNRSSVRYESDLAQHKPRCDVIVIGAAHSPSGAPARRVEVGIRIRRLTAIPNLAEAGTLLDHRLVVHGARAFVRNLHRARDKDKDQEAGAGAAGADGWALTEAEPFLSLPLRYEHAFGGELKVYEEDEAAERLEEGQRLSAEARARHPEGDAAPVAHAACAENPLGVGFLQAWYAEAAAVDRWPAPRIEAPGAPITAEVFERMVRGEARAGELPELSPRGVGVVAKPWPPRIKLAGTLDERWQAERWPDMPLDFDMAYWNGAHPDMQCEHLWGGEVVEVWNLLPASASGVAPPEGARIAARFVLPDVGLAAHLALEGGEKGYAPAPIDTLILDLEEMRLSIVWRTLTPASIGVQGAALVAFGDTGERA